jgi:integrase
MSPLKRGSSILRTAKEIGDRFYPLYFIAIHTGMRLSEIIGLKWVDVNWDLSTIQVKRQVMKL